MLEEEKDTEQEEGKTQVEENESEPSPPIEGANVAEDQDLKVLPESEEEEQKEIIVAADVAKKSLPRATTTDKRTKQKQLEK
ncbi:MAG TPA: hypothetical protein VI278_12655 [Nitrososphaeraceae archaeon]